MTALLCLALLVLSACGGQSAGGSSLESASAADPVPAESAASVSAVEEPEVPEIPQYHSETDQDGDGVAEPTSHIVRKLAHVTEFAVVEALLWLRLESRGHRRARTALLLSAGVGAVDETLQIFSHRGSAVSDVLIDTLGAALGISLALLLSAWARRRRESSGQK